MALLTPIVRTVTKLTNLLTIVFYGFDEGVIFLRFFPRNMRVVFRCRLVGLAVILTWEVHSSMYGKS